MRGGSVFRRTFLAPAGRNFAPATRRCQVLRWASSTGNHGPSPLSQKNLLHAQQRTQELLKRYGPDLFHQVPAAEASAATAAWHTPLLVAMLAATGAGILYLTLPPASFHPVTIDNKKLGPLAPSGPKTHGEYDETEVDVEEPAKMVEQDPVEAHAEAKSVTIPSENVQKEQEIPAVAPVETKPEAPVLKTPLIDPSSGLIKARYVLVGGGTASYSAMKAIQDRDPEADILMITSEKEVPYMRPPLSKELWFSDDEDVKESMRFKDWGGVRRELFYQPATGYQVIEPNALESGAAEKVPSIPTVLVGTTVESMDVESQVLLLANGKKVKYSKVLLATGGNPKVLSLVQKLPDAIRQQFSTFRTTEDFRKVYSLVAEGGKTIAVVGGGFLGSELACAFAHKGKKNGTTVTQFYPEDGNMAQVFPKYLVDWTTSRVEAEGVKTVPKVQITSIDALPESQKVSLKLSNGNSIEADHVVMAVGIEPNVKIAKDAGLEIDEVRGGIVSNAELEARTNVYVAGDVGSFHDIALGRRRVEHHDHAILTGRVAGKNMTGKHEPYRQQSMFWSDLGPEIGYEAVGLLDPSLATVGIWAKATEQDTPKQALQDSQGSVAAPGKKELTPTVTDGTETYGKGVVLYLRDEAIVGVLLWNVFHRTQVARRLINEKRGVEDIAGLAALLKIHDEH